jgi:serine/threonine protein kinase
MSDPQRDADRRQQIESLFHRACELPVGEREGFLESVCGADGALRTEVASLLRALGSEGDFLERNAATMVTTNPDDPAGLAGRRVGSFTVGTLIHEGGMAFVYEASQQAPSRSVALKVMKGLWTNAGARRFLYESEILAKLQHSDIAHVYESGVYESGGVRLPYFALELLKGAKSVTQFAKDAGLSLRGKIQMFDPVCAAVHHAHQKGIIHRDLKPSNILVGSDGVPKVIDFGIARVTDPEFAGLSTQTQVGRLFGTFAYMSPEQCDGESSGPDVRSDVYSLGVILYELVCGDLPYNVTKTSFLGAAKIVKEAPPRNPRLVNPSIDDDLSRILLKCVAKEAALRYQSAAELAADLNRYLRHEPVLARAPSLLYRARKFYERNRAVCWVGATLVLSVAALSARLNLLSQEAATHRTSSSENARKKAQFYNTLQNIVVSLGLSNDANPADHHGEAELIDRIAEQILAGAPEESRWELMQYLAFAMRGRGDRERAIRLFEQCLACAASARVPRPLQTSAILALAGLCSQAGKNESAELHANSILQIPPVGRSHEVAWSVLRDVALRQRKFDLHIRCQENLIDLTSGASPGTPEYRANYYYYSRLGVSLKNIGDFETAEKKILIARERAERDTTIPKWDILTYTNAFASVQFRRGRIQEALHIYDDLLRTVAQETSPPDPWPWNVKKTAR